MPGMRIGNLLEFMELVLTMGVVVAVLAGLVVFDRWAGRWRGAK